MTRARTPAKAGAHDPIPNGNSDNHGHQSRRSPPRSDSLDDTRQVFHRRLAPHTGAGLAILQFSTDPCTLSATKWDDKVKGLTPVCFSPEADFTAAAAIGVVGVATLRRARTRRELIVAALPAGFAAHQFTEGFVWLGLHHEVSSGLSGTAMAIYVIYAQAVLPIIVPIGFLLIEPSRRHRRMMAPLVALGLGVGGYLLWTVTQYPVYAVEHAHCIAYVTNVIHIDHHSLFEFGVGAAYVAATAGAALLSSRRYLRWFGAVNLVGVSLAVTLYYSEFTSVWCVYAALVSFLVLEHFRRQRQLEETHGHASGLLSDHGFDKGFDLPSVPWNPGRLIPGDSAPVTSIEARAPAPPQT
jgi:hypothetical protein